MALKLLDQQIEYYKNNLDKEYVKSYYETRAGKAEKEYFLDPNLDYRDKVAERISNETDGD